MTPASARSSYRNILRILAAYLAPPSPVLAPNLGRFRDLPRPPTSTLAPSRRRARGSYPLSLLYILS